ncbi:hypothetical protein GGR56DRAFT_222689 [Xylariaceae sp. FL0804]|nr:hypothetical protein GGR56DRAFT_222689 [Xylariaceae sp. FL0804]
MPKFPVNFRRKSAALDDPNGPIAEPSFKVLERPEVSSGTSFDGGARYVAARTASRMASRSNLHDMTLEDNLFAGTKNNRGSGSSNATKAASDKSSRHSNASTAPSSTEFTAQEDWRHSSNKKPMPPTTSPAPLNTRRSSGFLRQAGRTFSFGVSKKSSLPPTPADDPVPRMPEYPPQVSSGRSRAETTSTVSTAVPPRVDDSDFMLDLGGDLSNMLGKFDKRSSIATLKGHISATAPPTRTPPAPTTRAPQPPSLHIDHTAPIEPSPKSWNSQASNEALLTSGRTLDSPDAYEQERPPPVPKHESASASRRVSDDDSEDVTLLRDSVAAAAFLAPGGSSTRYRREDDRAPSFTSGASESYSKHARFELNQEGDLFDKSFAAQAPKMTHRIGPRSQSQPHNKVMTPEEFEAYRANKAREERLGLADPDDSDKEQDDNYDDEEDDTEKTKQLAKQRRKQEAHMTLYRQQMMKVTGESSTGGAPRPNLPVSMSTPILPSTNIGVTGPSPVPPSDGSSEDEEIPLAILAAHGFPNKNRPPTRLSTAPSQPNLRASMQPSYVVGPGSVAGDAPSGANGGRLPPFARRLPQDPYVGAGLINQPQRESFALGGGAPASNRAVPSGGLVGVIANEERSRAMRRGSPAVDHIKDTFPPSVAAGGMPIQRGFDPMAGIPSQMMYPMGMAQMQPPMTTGDQAQIQLTQQMSQFMQMQMQFMQMMAANNQNQAPGQPRPQSHMPTQSMGTFGDMSRNSFLSADPSRNSFLGADPSRNSVIGGDMSRNSFLGSGPGMGHSMGMDSLRAADSRTMSMVQPNSSWLQPPSQPGFAPSIHVSNAGYTPSIAPSERSNVGLPGRYRPVSSVNLVDQSNRTMTMSGALPQVQSNLKSHIKPSAGGKDDDDDDEQGWAAMKAKRDQKRNLWRSKKDFGSDIGALIS